jgi:hypothetical protein
MMVRHAVKERVDSMRPERIVAGQTAESLKSGLFSIGSSNGRILSAKITQCQQAIVSK